jgi:hypothetical protein
MANGSMAKGVHASWHGLKAVPYDLGAAALA